MIPVRQLAEQFEKRVAFARAQEPRYGKAEKTIAAPELPGGKAEGVAACAVRDLLLNWGLDAQRFGTTGWNPLGAFIQPGQRVVLKPNWVLHRNEGGFGFDCLCTHGSVIDAVLEYVAIARPGMVVIGDAPLQKCVFDELLTASGMKAVLAKYQARGLEVWIQDFRRTMLFGDRLGAARREDIRRLEQYVLFDLGEQSLLEPISGDYKKFRVTMYNPKRLRRTHAPGRHQYLIAREVIDADVVINLPKLKCHCKAGVTGALKNLVGINGNKEFLPHHRKGGKASGGDCYEGQSMLKGCAESLADTAAKLSVPKLQALASRSSEIAVSVAKRIGNADTNLEGAWHGNDTVWRMCLDLQRLLHYGQSDATLSSTPTRTVLTITDAIIGGEGEGPLRPEPVASGFLTGGTNPAAVEWVNALLMGLDPSRIPLTTHSFDDFSYPIAGFRPAQIELATIGAKRDLSAVEELRTVRFRPSQGWIGHCELQIDDDVSGKPTLVA
ncbi:MAG: DUF362 domain-containing protein [Acidobacteriaceae bacterium]|nr:DUF362 domain-containing protein [Acidobacteriaceae bacterium]MBV9500825.1 DUF362 domain-containing protein [Acidobacteriaceae bacterium]